VLTPFTQQMDSALTNMQCNQTSLPGRVTVVLLNRLSLRYGRFGSVKQRAPVNPVSYGSKTLTTGVKVCVQTSEKNITGDSSLVGVSQYNYKVSTC